MTPFHWAIFFGTYVHCAKGWSAGALVIAVGADAKGKRELGAGVMRGACVICDSKTQCLQLGEAGHAAREKVVK